MDLQLAGKRALITGGSRGIGLAAGHALVAEGADVALAARDKGRLAAARDAVAAGAAVHGGRVLALVSDATDDGAVRAAVAQAAEGLGGVDILVNAAAEPAKPGPRLPLADIPSWRRRGAWRSPGTPSRPAGSGRRDPLLSQRNR